MNEKGVEPTAGAAEVEHDVSFLLGGGQMKGGACPKLFMIYSAGNFIECTIDTPYLQIRQSINMASRCSTALSATTPIFYDKR